MLKIHKLTFNPFMENTYVVSDETKDCLIIDPGCCNAKEQNELLNTISSFGLKPVKLLNTHCHVDHIPGNKFVFDKFGLLPEIHEKELDIMHRAPQFASFFGFDCPVSPEPKTFITEGDMVKFGGSAFEVIFTPGHSPGSISFYSAADKLVISGDVLFYMSVGRFDIPDADGDVLMDTLKNKMMKLPDDVKVYSGHGPETTIGFERYNNPFIR